MDLDEPRIAKEYDRLAVDIEHYVGDYKGFWKESVRSVTFPPQVDSQTAWKMVEANKKGKLRPYIESKYKIPNVVNAFMSFFETHDIEQYF